MKFARKVVLQIFQKFDLSLSVHQQSLVVLQLPDRRADRKEEYSENFPENSDLRQQFLVDPINLDYWEEDHAAWIQTKRVGTLAQEHKCHNLLEVVAGHGSAFGGIGSGKK